MYWHTDAPWLPDCTGACQRFSFWNPTSDDWCLCTHTLSNNLGCNSGRGYQSPFSACDFWGFCTCVSLVQKPLCTKVLEIAAVKSPQKENYCYTPFFYESGPKSPFCHLFNYYCSRCPSVVQRDSCTLTPAMTRWWLAASYRLSPAEAATAASQAERTLPPLPHLCSACSPPACHASAGSVLQPQADLIYHVTNGTKQRQIHNDPAGLLGKTKVGAKEPFSLQERVASLSHQLSVSQLINIRSHVNVFICLWPVKVNLLPLLLSFWKVCADQEISMFCFTHGPVCWFSQEEGTRQKSETERTLNLFYSIELPWGQGLKNWHLGQIGGWSFSGVAVHGTISETVCVHKS